MIKSMFHNTGLLKLKHRLFPRRELIILGYHTIEAPYFMQRVLGIGARRQDFEDQIRYVADHFTVVSMDELLRAVSDDTMLPSNAVMITFDDGYADLYHDALPILKEYNLPATVFLVTECISNRRSIWVNRLYYWLDCTHDQTFTVQITETDTLSLNLSQQPIRRKSVLELTAALKRMSPAARDDTMDQIADTLKIDATLDPSDELPMLTWQQVKELADNGIEIGSHSHTHPIMSHCSDRDCLHELTASKEIIEMQIGRPCRTVAYPNGQPDDYNEATMKAVRSAGYEAAFTFHMPLNLQSRYTIGRKPLFDVSLPEFATELS